MAPRDAKEQLLWISKLLTLSLRLNKTARWKLVSAARIPMNALTHKELMATRAILVKTYHSKPDTSLTWMH